MEENPYQSPASDGAVQAHISEPIHVSGRLTYEDYWAIGGMYGQAGKWQRRFTWWACSAVLILMMVQGGRYWYLELKTHTVLEILAAIRLSTYLLCISPIAILAGILGIIWWARRVGKAASAAGEGIYAVRDFVFSEECVDIRSSNVDSQVRWDAFSSQRQNEDYLALHLKPEGSGSIAIARKWFDDAAKWCIVVEYAGQRIGQHAEAVESRQEDAERRS